MSSSLRRLTRCAVHTALALALSVAEGLVPLTILFPLPGLRLGLANLVTIVGLYLVSLPQLILISLVRIVLAGLTFGNGFSMIYSLAGGALSLLFMLLARKTGWFSQAGVSVAGGVGHNVGQLVIAALVQLVEMFLQKAVPALYQALGIYLPLITTNCAVLGVALLNIQDGYNFVESLVYGITGGIGFTVAILLFSSVRERLEDCDCPKAFRGFPIALLAAGLLALSFMGFSGFKVFG